MVSRQFTWMPWWQELILNWVASWSSISLLVAVDAEGEHQAEFHLPTDIQLQRQELEEMLQQTGER